jgi:enoyl-CoA hydratase/carnithine racemase
MTDKMIAEKRDGIGWMTFNNPQRHNAVSLEMWAAICDILEDFAADDGVRVVVLKGAGDKAFVAGADISQFDDHRGSVDATANYDKVVARANTMLAEFAKPTIAMIQGYCIGGGLAIALGCDLRFAGPNSQFAIPAARLGLGYGRTGVNTLINLVGPSFAKEIFFTARRFSAEEALAMGLINRVLPESELVDFTQATCATIAANAPLTVKSIKTIVGEHFKSQGGDKALCDRLVAECFASEDYKEGRRAFMEKRAPQFKGH